MGRFSQQTWVDARARADTVYRDYLDPVPASKGLPGFLGSQTHLWKFVARDNVGKGWIPGSLEGGEVQSLLQDPIDLSKG